MIAGASHNVMADRPEEFVRVVLDFLDDRNALEAFRKMRRKSEYLVNNLPSQYEYLSHIRAQSGVEDCEGPYWAVRRQNELAMTAGG